MARNINSSTTSKSDRFDIAAVGLSGLCVIHCLGLPILAASLPLLGSLAEAEWVHAIFVALAALISMIALSRSPDGSLKSVAAVLAIAGMAALLGGVLGWPLESGEVLMTVLGSLLLTSAHLINWRLVHRR